jgi:hypothetical protein
MDMAASGVQAAAQPLAGALEGSAVLEELAVVDAFDPDVGGVRGLMIGTERLRVVRRR